MRYQMKSPLLAGALCALAAPFLASAQCVAPVTPNNLLLGQTWAFRVASANLPVGSNFSVIQSAAAGTFTGLAQNNLSAVVTNHETNGNGRNLVSRLAAGQGRWSSNIDCRTGVIFINKFSNTPSSYQLDFILVNGGTEMILSGSDSFGNPVSGQARLNPPKSCNGVNPLLTIAGATYGYTLEGNGRSEVGSVTGIFGGFNGFLLVNTRTIRQLNPPLPPGSEPLLDLFGGSGRYIIYPDCSGGELLIMNRLYPVQLEFVFSKADFSEMYLVNDDLQEFPYSGVARRQ